MILQTRRSDPHNLGYCRSAQQNRIGLKPNEPRPLMVGYMKSQRSTKPHRIET